MMKNKPTFFIKTFNWLREIAVIVIGVSITLLGDKCKNDYEENEVTMLIYQNLISDLEKDSTQLAGMIDYSIENEQRAVRFFDNMEQPEKLGDSLIYFINGLAGSSIFAPTNTTYEEIKQNGFSKLIKNQAIKRKIFELYTNVYKEVDIVCAKTGNFIDTEVLPHLHEKMPFVRQQSDINATQQAALIAFCKNDKTKNLAKMSVSEKNMMLRTYENAFEAVKELLALLKKEKRG
jgi:hypothetical protein